MARFFFDVRDVRGFHRDETGDECASIEEARQQAQSILSDIARHELPDSNLHVIVCDVRDEKGHVVYRGDLTYRGRWLS